MPVLSFSPGYETLLALRVPVYIRESRPKQNSDVRSPDCIVLGGSAHPSAAEATGKRFAGNVSDKPCLPENPMRALDDGLPVGCKPDRSSWGRCCREAARSSKTLHAAIAQAPGFSTELCPSIKMEAGCRGAACGVNTR